MRSALPPLPYTITSNCLGTRPTVPLSLFTKLYAVTYNVLTIIHVILLRRSDCSRSVTRLRSMRILCSPITCLELAATNNASSANNFCQRNRSLMGISTSSVSRIETLPLCHLARSPCNMKRYHPDRQTDML
jgi:hypothetical protein